MTSKINVYVNFLSIRWNVILEMRILDENKIANKFSQSEQNPDWNISLLLFQTIITEPKSRYQRQPKRYRKNSRNCRWQY